MSADSLAIIPARGGSKRIPRKNLKPFRGKPIIAWSIEAALQSGLFKTVMVSTDDAEIAETALAYGACVPFYRSAENADDHTPVEAVLAEVLLRYHEQGERFAAAACLYPTAPLIRIEDLRAGRGLLDESGADVIVPVATFPAPIWRSFSKNDNGHLDWNFPEHRLTRSQDLAEAYHDAGQWYWFDVDSFLKRGTLLAGRMVPFILPAQRVQDIDTDEDWAVCELKHERMFG